VGSIDIINGQAGGADIVDVIIDGAGSPKGRCIDSIGPI